MKFGDDWSIGRGTPDCAVLNPLPISYMGAYGCGCGVVGDGEGVGMQV